MDHFSPLVPAYIRVLALPIGQIERSSFATTLTALQQQCSIVPLRDFQSHSTGKDFSLSPSTDDNGSLLYDFRSSWTAESQQQLSPFELWREPLLAIGIVSSATGSADDVVKAGLEQLRERYGRVVHRHVLVLQDSDTAQPSYASEDATFVLVQHGLVDLDLKPALQTISVRLLQELSTYAQAMQASPNIQTPGQPVQGLLRSMLPRDEERPRSHHGTPLEPRSPSGEDGGSRPTSREFMPPPATNFDQIAAANSLGRSDSNGNRRSKSRPRKDSLDRVPVQALSKEKLKDRGKARVGVVFGSIHLLAGQWSEALKMLVDNTTRLRALSDHIWHAKGLEYTLVCLLLHLWASIDFQVPPICYQLSDKVRDRLSKAIVTEIQQRVSLQQTSTERLASSIPDLLKHILLLYHATESSLELPYITVAEATVRFCKLLTSLHTNRGVLTPREIDKMLRPSKNAVAAGSTGLGHQTQPGAAKLNKTTIADLLSHALPLQEESVKVVDYISILTGAASVYSELGMQRKKVVLLRSVVARLTVSMEQARKLGAAEMGIHPAASLSIENGPEALLDTVKGSTGLLDLARTIVAVFGVQLSQPDMHKSQQATLTYQFGSDTLKSEIFRDLLRLCEAAPDLAGISALVAAMMAHIVPLGLSDTSARRPMVTESPEEQARYLTMTSRSHWLSKQLGLPEVLADYWDPNLIRSVDLKPLVAEHTLLRRAADKPDSAAEGSSNSNPLLYDPFAPKEKASNVVQVLVSKQSALCQVTLQNALDTVIDIEYLELVVDGVGLAGRLNSVQIGPARLQQVTFEVRPSVVGQVKITACRVKVAGCREQSFRITQGVHADTPVKLLKSIGQDMLADPTNAVTADANIIAEDVVVDIIEPQPVLDLNGQVRPSTTLMLLAGEEVKIEVSLINNSAVPAVIQQIKSSNELVCTSADAERQSLQPAESRALIFELQADRNATEANIDILYGTQADSQFARSRNIKLDLTVHPGMQISWVDSKAHAKDSFGLMVDLYNSWHQTLHAVCEVNINGSWQQQGLAASIAAGQIRRLDLDMKRWFSNVKVCATATQCAEELGKRFRVAWHCDQRTGFLSLQPAMLPIEVVEAIRGPAFDISLRAVTNSDTTVVKAGAFFTVEATVMNRSGADSEPLHMQLHCTTRGIRPALARQGVAVAGSMHRLLPKIQAGSSTTAHFALCGLNSGELEIGAITRPALPSPDSKESVTQHRLRLKVVG